ncbi:MAG TPA: SUKH-4 family immunity protein [Pirellulaceae bacterium]|nr:SUKH-4 family immunity protein [Pirellulaceae bacterium]
MPLADADKKFLVEAGLPESAAPFLGFTVPKSGELPTVADQWDQPDEFRRYRVIGSDGSGNPIAIDDEQSGEVVHLDHEGDFARTFMNKTIRQLAESLLAYRTIVGDSADESSGEIPMKVRIDLALGH